MWSMVWAVDPLELDALECEILETCRSGKLGERARRAAHRYSIWGIGADVGFASQGRCLIEQLMKISRSTERRSREL